MNTTIAPAGSGPLHIDCIALDLPSAPAATSARIGMCHCPGRSRPDGRGRAWQRSLMDDVAALGAAGFDTVLTLLDDDELTRLGADGLPAQLRRAGIDSLRFPIADFGVPDDAAQRAWRAVQADLLARLHAGQSVLVHCAAGLGRTGTMVAVLLKALGETPALAVARVRAARPGTIETEDQLRFVHDFQPFEAAG